MLNCGDMGNVQRQLFYSMLRIRMVEEKIAELYHEQEMRCPVHLCTGQEAVSSGATAMLKHDDYVLSNHRSHGHYLAKGGDLDSMISEIYGKSSGCCMGKGGSMHLVDLDSGFLGSVPIVGSTIPVAVGTAFGSKALNQDHVTVIFFGDGAAEEGVLHESLNFSFLKKLPIIFVCENNFFSVYSPLKVRQSGIREIYQIAQGHGMESHQGDGNDVMDVYEKVSVAVEKARDGKGPTFLEFKTYRWREHCGPNFDNDIGYREETDFMEWKKKCPVESFKKQLINNGTITVKDIAAIERNISLEIEKAFNHAKEDSFPHPSVAHLHVYAD